MVKDEKNQSDNSQNSMKDNSLALASYAGSGLLPNFYNKTNKLITALYMVTDIMNQGEPLRNKLRTLGAEIVSDIYALSLAPSLYSSIQVMNKISETLSFLEIASTINLVSTMNCNILKKEFIQLRKSIEDSTQNGNVLDGKASLSEFFKEEVSLPEAQKENNNNQNQNIGHAPYVFPKMPTRLGVQNASTLMKAISDRTSQMSDKYSAPKEPKEQKTSNNFDVLKNSRRNEILYIIKAAQSSGATITDIKTKAKGALASVGEKTLQRELISMVKDGVLYKTGEKRWSRYFLPK